MSSTADLNGLVKRSSREIIDELEVCSIATILAEKDAKNKEEMLNTKKKTILVDALPGLTTEPLK